MKEIIDVYRLFFFFLVLHSLFSFGTVSGEVRMLIFLITFN